MILQLLKELRENDPEVFSSDAILRCIVFLGRGQFDSLAAAVKMAQVDVRDVILDKNRKNLFLPFQGPTYEKNYEVFRYLYRRRPKRDVPDVAMPASVENPYSGCGAHPDIVERLWDEIGTALPTDCRCLIFGTPALAHVQAGHVLAISSGTAYALCLPGLLAATALKSGAKTRETFLDGDLDLCRSLGEDWVFGSWKSEEVEWCKKAYAIIDQA